MLVDLYPEMGASVTASVSGDVSDCVPEQFNRREIVGSLQFNLVRCLIAAGAVALM